MKSDNYPWASWCLITLSLKMPNPWYPWSCSQHHGRAGGRSHPANNRYGTSIWISCVEMIQILRAARSWTMPFFLCIIHHPNYYMWNAGLCLQTFKGRDGWAWMGSGKEFSVSVCVLAGWLNGWMTYCSSSRPRCCGNINIEMRQLHNWGTKYRS